MRREAVNRSLHGQLLRDLGWAILVTALLAGCLSFWLAYEEAEDDQDDTLRQMASLADSAYLRKDRIRPVPDATIDPETRILVTALPSPRFSWLQASLSTGYHTVHSPEGDWRVFVRQGAAGKLAVAQVTEARDDLARHSALLTLLPLLCLMLLLRAFAGRRIRHEFAGLLALAQEVDRRAPGCLDPLPEHGVPAEILPFTRSINLLLSRVQELMEAQGRFIADAAHELRSPLTALMIQIENLEALAPPSLEERLRRLKEGIDRTSRLSEQLLRHARTAVVPLHVTEVDCFDLGRQVIGACLPLAESRDMDLGLDCNGTLQMTTDPQWLQVILRNAVDNGLRYAPRGTAVTLRVVERQGWTIWEVEDEGPGIPDAEKVRVFQAFYRRTGSGQEGSGLGLAIAQDAALRLGGRVDLRDGAAGKGVIFSYRQPLRQDKP